MINPKNSLERSVRKYLAVVVALCRALFNRKTIESTRPILTNGQGIREKHARIRAELLGATSQEFWSDRNMNLLGMRVIDCVCGPSLGHNNAPPKRKTRLRRK